MAQAEKRPETKRDSKIHQHTARCVINVDFQTSGEIRIDLFSFPWGRDYFPSMMLMVMSSKKPQVPCFLGVYILLAETGINTLQRDTKLRECRDVVCALKKNKTAQGGRVGMQSPGELARQGTRAESWSLGDSLHPDRGQ